MFVDRKAWVFDLDGTLTIAAHDFDAMREALELPPGGPILEALEGLSGQALAWRLERLRKWEWDVAAQTRPAVAADALLTELRGRGARVGILTRNLRDVALHTLELAGLGRHFDPVCVLGREDCAAKPSPEGIHRLLVAWQIAPDAAVMVGDTHFDVDAGRAAGTATVFVGTGTAPEQGDVVIPDLSHLVT